MKIFPLFFITCTFLTSCSHDYLRLSDVPPYTPPSISPKEAQKEINELIQERGPTRTTQDLKK